MVAVFALPAIRSVVCKGFFAQKSSSLLEAPWFACGIALARASMTNSVEATIILMLSMVLIVDERSSSMCSEKVAFPEVVIFKVSTQVLEVPWIIRYLGRSLARVFSGIEGLRGRCRCQYCAKKNIRLVGRERL